MDMFRTPGASLEGAEKKKFDETKELIDGATNDFLVRADWNANMSCVDSVNSMRDGGVLNEVMFLLRKKLTSKSPQTVGLTMQLIGTLVNNCGNQFHTVMNDEKFMREMGNAIRYFSKRPGAENKDVTDVSLDLVQSWGEAFLPRRKQFYHIVDLYFTLRKEGLPFKVQQFDPTRVPIFAGSGATGGTDNTDAILAAALQSSMTLELEAEEAEQRRQQGRHPVYSDNPAHRNAHEDREYRDHRASPAASNTAEEVQSLQSCMSILKDLILASTHQMDFRHNEVAQEVLTQLQTYQRKMPALIEQALMSDAQGVETLIMLNENSQSLSAIYNKIKSCEVNLLEGQRQASAISCGEDSQPAPAHAPTVTEHRRSPAHHTDGGDADLLGINDSSSSPRHHDTHQHQHHQQHHSAHHQPQANTPSSHGHHTPRHHPHQQQHAPAHFEPPVHSTSHHPQSHPQYPPEYPAQQYAPQYSQPAVRIAAPLIPPPGHGHGHAHTQAQQHRAPILAPPPAHHAHAPAQSYAQSPAHVHGYAHPAPVPVKSLGSDEIITVAAKDPFAPDSLDALFSSAPAPHPTKPAAAVHHAVQPVTEEIVLPQPKDHFAPDALDALFSSAPAPHPTKPAAAVHHAVQPVNPEEIVLPQPKDHFAPDALDALFDSKPPVVSGVKADPFSDAALDALFDAPPRPTYGAHHQAHAQHTATYSHQSHQSHQAQTTVHYAQHGAVPHSTHYPPAPPAHGSSPLPYSPHHGTHGGPHQVPAQYPPQYGQQYAQPGAYPVGAHQQAPYGQGYPPQGYTPQQGHPQAHPPQGYAQAYPQQGQGHGYPQDQHQHQYQHHPQGHHHHPQAPHGQPQPQQLHHPHPPPANPFDLLDS